MNGSKSLFRIPRIGQPAPRFRVGSPSNPRFAFDTVAGRHVILCFFRSRIDPIGGPVLSEFLVHRTLFDDYNLSFFGVSNDADDERLLRVKEQSPGIHFFWDFNHEVSSLYGVTKSSETGSLPEDFELCSIVLDERLRIVATITFNGTPQEHVAAVLASLKQLPALNRPTVAETPAPILIVPRVFEPELCSALINYYEGKGGRESGFMREVNGNTVEMVDYGHKRRMDVAIDDDQLKQACVHRIHDRLIPEIIKAFQFYPTRIERYIVACYEAESGGHFRPHRDNTTKGTAHRRFAVSLVLNAEQFEGGTLRFPEFGRQSYGPPSGAAIVFSCSLLHEATAVTSGKRYVFLPFLYDDAAAKIREENLKFIQR